MIINTKASLSEYKPSFLKKCGLTIDSTFEEVTKNLLWGTYGKYPKKTKRVKWVKLCECSKEHLQAILETQKQISMLTRAVIYTLLGNEKGVTHDFEGSRWGREGYDPFKGDYNGYTVLYVTNTAHVHENHPEQVVYRGDNGKIWSMPLSEWPGNLVQEENLFFFI